MLTSCIKDTSDLLERAPPAGGGGSSLIFVRRCANAASKPIPFLLRNLRKRHPFSCIFRGKTCYFSYILCPKTHPFSCIFVQTTCPFSCIFCQNHTRDVGTSVLNRSQNSKSIISEVFDSIIDLESIFW